MNLKSDELKTFLKMFLMMVWAVCVWYVFDQIHHRGVFFFAIMALGAAAFFAVVWLFRNKWVNLPERGAGKASYWTWAILATAGLAVLVLSFQLPVQVFNNVVGRLLAALLFAGVGAVVVFLKGSTRSIYIDFAILLLGYGLVYRVVGFLPEIQNGAFALGWSEGSRFYNASTFAARQLYGASLPLPVLHPTRYLLQALPFFVGINSIFAHRVWQVILWLGMTLLGSWLVARRVSGGLHFPLWLLTAFCWLFFFQGAVYYHLMVVAIFVLAGYNAEKPFRTLLFVILAALWAGISRINWIPVPGLLAMTLYLFDKPMDLKHWFKYLSWPAIWTLFSLGVGLLSKQVYTRISGEDPALFDSAFSSALLWYRLFPNATFFMGILLAIGLVCLPLIVLVVKKMKGGLYQQVAWPRCFLLGGILVAFFLGGVLVSLKIGGGGDLHNLDAFLVFFLVIALNVLAGKLALDKGEVVDTGVRDWRPIWLMLTLIIPVFFTMIKVGAGRIAWVKTDDSDLQKLNQAINLTANELGKVLFISERQLLTFDSLDYREVVSPYEKVFLMEMAMGGNQPYLEQFYADLASGEFKAIVTDTINTNLQERNRSFSEENNVWVQLVLEPMLEKYEPALQLRNGGAYLLIPKGNETLLEQIKTLAD